MFFFKNKGKFSDFIPQDHYATRTLNYNLPVHRLTLTEKLPTYACITFFNKLPASLKKEYRYKSFKQKLLNLLVEIEPYSISEFMNYTISD